jgi:hypothetical protein
MQHEEKSVDKLHYIHSSGGRIGDAPDFEHAPAPCRR